MKIVTAGMAASVVIIASMFHPLVLHAAAFQHANIKLTVVADSPYNYEIKEDSDSISIVSCGNCVINNFKNINIPNDKKRLYKLIICFIRVFPS